MTFEEFWPEYVRAHSRQSTRAMHCVGTLTGWMMLGVALVLALRSSLVHGLQAQAPAGRPTLKHGLAQVLQVQALKPWWWIFAALLVPYALAWISHFFVEHNVFQLRVCKYKP